jgi:uroporphyrinogen III methyltransferase / synthase
MTSVDSPRVFLVGAGPGDPGLITRRGLELVRRCDVLLHDRLVAPALVAEAPAAAEVVFVGKSPGETSMPQAAIDALIVARAREGKLVVRLKGGDPFVFGRGADEAQALAAAGLPFEIVPGISAAIAVPAYAGVPVTHGGVASSFAVLTGHESSPRPGTDERFRAIAAGAETIVLLMGVSSLGDTARRLIEAGRSPQEPVALIERGTTPRQRTVVATLVSVGEVALESRVQAPVTAIVGSVVRLRDALGWFERRPLFGRRIVVTRAREQASSMIHMLQELGAEVVSLPTIAFEDPDSFDEVDNSIQELLAGTFSWVLFSSANAVERYFARLRRTHDARAFGRTRVAAVGPATASRLASFGIVPDVVPEEHTARAAASALGEGTGRVLLPRPLDAPRDTAAALRELGWQVTDVVAYRTIAPEPDPAALGKVRAGAFDVLTFTSASSVKNFVELAGADAIASLRTAGTLVACIGPPTATAARSAGLDVHVIPSEQTASALIQAVADHFARTLEG